MEEEYEEYIGKETPSGLILEEETKEEQKFRETSTDIVEFYDPSLEYGWLSPDFPQSIVIDEIEYKSPLHYIFSKIIGEESNDNPSLLKSKPSELSTIDNGISLRNRFAELFKTKYKYQRSENKIFHLYFVYIKRALNVKYKDKTLSEKLKNLGEKELRYLDINPFLGIGTKNNKGFNTIGKETSRILDRDPKITYIELGNDSEWLSPEYMYHKEFKSLLHLIYFSILSIGDNSVKEIIKDLDIIELKEYYWNNVMKYKFKLDFKGKEEFKHLRLKTEEDFMKLMIEKIAKEKMEEWYSNLIKINLNKFSKLTNIFYFSSSIKPVKRNRKEIEKYRDDNKYDPLLILSNEGENLLPQYLNRYYTNLKRQTTIVVRNYNYLSIERWFNSSLKSIINTLAFFYNYILIEREGFLHMSVVHEFEIVKKTLFSKTVSYKNVPGILITLDMVQYLLKEIFGFYMYSKYPTVNTPEMFITKVEEYLKDVRGKVTVISKDLISTIYHILHYSSKCFSSKSDEESQKIIDISSKLYLLTIPFDYSSIVKSLKLNIVLDRNKSLLIGALFFIMMRLIDYQNLNKITLDEIVTVVLILRNDRITPDIDKFKKNSDEIILLFEELFKKEEVEFLEDYSIFIGVFYYLLDEMKNNEYILRRISFFSKTIQ